MISFTADALSDAILALVCLVLWRRVHNHRAMRWVYGLIALAAVLGVLRFSQVNYTSGPHQFFSQVAALVAIPLWGITRYWPNTLLTHHHSAAALFVLFVGGIGIVITVFFPWFTTLTAAVGAVTLALSWRWHRTLIDAIGITTLFAAFAVSSLQWSWHSLSSIQLLHYLMSLGMVLMSLTPSTHPTSQR